MSSLSSRSFAVIGAGVVGLALSRALARRGGDVLLFEARRAGGGASGASAGMLPSPRGGRSHLARLIRGAHEGYETFVQEVESESGMTVEFRRLGFADLAIRGHEEVELRKRYQRNTVGEACWLSPAELRRLAPGISPGVLGALSYPQTAWVNPPRLVSALEQSAESLGVEIRTGSEAAIARSEDGKGWDVLPDRGGGERLRGREVLVAAGAWSGEILRRAGTEAPAKLVPIRGQMVEVECDPAPKTILNHGDVYLIPRTGDTVWVGATVEDVGFNEGTSRDGIQWLLESAQEFLPHLGSPRRSWAGLRPKLLRRGGPLLGEGDPPVLSGHYRSGIHLGPITAHLLASRLAGEDPADPSPFRY